MDEARNAQGNAAVPAAVAGASRPRFGEVNVRDRGRMPHRDKDGGLYFVTFHLADSLPESIREEIRKRRQLLEVARPSGRKLLKVEEDTLKKTSTKAIEHLLDAGHGSCAMRDPRDVLATRVLGHFDSDRGAFQSAVAYIEANPEPAGLANWPWVGCGSRED